MNPKYPFPKPKKNTKSSSVPSSSSLPLPLKNQLSTLVRQLLSSKSLEEKIKKASLKDISFFLKASIEILSSEEKFRATEKAPETITSIEKLISSLPEEEIRKGLTLLSKIDENPEVKNNNSQVPGDSAIVPSDSTIVPSDSVNDSPIIEEDTRKPSDIRADGIKVSEDIPDDGIDSNDNHRQSEGV